MAAIRSKFFQPPARKPPYLQFDDRLRAIERATEHRSVAASTNSIRDPQTYETIVIPCNTLRLVRLPRRRKYRFAKRLFKTIEKAKSCIDDWPIADPFKPADKSQVSLPVLNSACATCQGACCTHGGTRAYLNGRRVIDVAQQMGLSETLDIVASYCRYLPQESYNGSCVFHSQQGCTLPVEMRSHTCRNFVCTGYSEIEERIDSHEPSKFFLASMVGERIVRTKFVR